MEEYNSMGVKYNINDSVDSLYEVHVDIDVNNKKSFIGNVEGSEIPTQKSMTPFNARNSSFGGTLSMTSFGAQF